MFIRWTTDNNFLKCTWANVVISMTESCLFLMLCSLRAKRSKASNINFQLCSCTQRCLSGFFESFYYIMCCRWWIFYVKEHYTENTQQFVNIVYWWLLNLYPYSFLSKKLFLYPVMWLICFQWTLISCNMFLSLFIYGITYFSTLSLTLPQLFLRRVAAIVYKMSSHFSKNIETKCLTSNIRLVSHCCG